MLTRALLTIVFICFSSVHVFSQHVAIKKYPRVEFTKVGDSNSDTLKFTARVRTIYQCPPCPEHAQCKPCIGDHVEVTNGNRDLDFRVFTHQLSLFEVDKTYDFLVRFRSKLHRNDNIELVTASKTDKN
jgi:hypothetical protein